MKQFFTIATLFFSLFAGAQRDIDVLHYFFDLGLNDENDSLTGIATIRFLVQRDISELRFDLESDKGGMEATGVLEKKGGDLPRSFVHAGDKLTIESSYRAGDTVELSIFYRGVPVDGLIISRNDYGDRTFFSDNWPDRARHWIPCVDDPADKATVEFRVTAPSRYKVVSNGVLVEERVGAKGTKTSHWKEETPLPTKVMVIGVADFAVKVYKDSPAGIPVTAWVYRQDSATGFKNYSKAPAILKFMADYIGPYPYKKLANVQSRTIFGGMENAGAIFYYEESATTAESIESLLAHEIAHQWFGDMATEKSFAHLWLSEGFATYLCNIYLESRYGRERLNREMIQDRAQVIDFARSSQQPVVDSVSPLMQLLNANSYQKGGWILHMLRHEIGDSLFHQVIRDYYQAYAGKNADSGDFEAIVEKASGRNMDLFFRQWLGNPGIPRLDINWEYDADEKTATLSIIQKQDSLFEFPLELMIETPNGKEKKKFSIRQKEEKFSFLLPSKPSRIVPDPETRLLFEGSVKGPGSPR